MSAGKYTIELFDKGGVLLADLTDKAKDRRLIKSRNEADDISWNLDLNTWEQYCEAIDKDPNSIIKPNSTEIRIKRGETYLGGGEITYAEVQVKDNSFVLNIKATGFLNLFNKRRTGSLLTFEDVSGPDIGWALINETQQKTNGDFGVTRGTIADTGLLSRQYARTIIKEGLQSLTTSELAPHDMEFTADKVYNTYARIGSNKPGIVFEFGRNILTLGVPLDGTPLYNELTAIGQGFGDEAQTQVIVSDLESQADYLLREDVRTYNDIVDQDLLEDFATADLKAVSQLIQVPSITVTGDIAPFITDYGIGDRVTITGFVHKMLRHLNDQYRIEKYELTVDDNDHEIIKLMVTR